MGDQQRDVACPFGERGQVDREDGEAVEEILAEAAGVDRGVDVAMGGGDDAHVDRDLAAAADPLHRPSSSTRSSFTCMSAGMSPISSRNRVPPSASSNCRYAGHGRR